MQMKCGFKISNYSIIFFKAPMIKLPKKNLIYMTTSQIYDPNWTSCTIRKGHMEFLPIEKKLKSLLWSVMKFKKMLNGLLILIFVFRSCT